jgi:hypothetical protein
MNSTIALIYKNNRNIENFDTLKNIISFLPLEEHNNVSLINKDYLCVVEELYRERVRLNKWILREFNKAEEEVESVKYKLGELTTIIKRIQGYVWKKEYVSRNIFLDYFEKINNQMLVKFTTVDDTTKDIFYYKKGILTRQEFWDDDLLLREYEYENNSKVVEIINVYRNNKTLQERFYSDKDITSHIKYRKSGKIHSIIDCVNDQEKQTIYYRTMEAPHIIKEKDENDEWKDVEYLMCPHVYEMNITELRKLSKELGLKGYADMKKEDLRFMINEFYDN